MSDVPSRILRETLRDQLGPPPSGSSGCLDAGVLAAWCDGTLRRRDRATVESHAATCARCQALLAAMAKTAAPRPARKWWQASTVRWLVPIAAVSALAVAVWMNAPSERLAAPALRTDRPASSALVPSSKTGPADAPAPAAEVAGTLERSSKDAVATLPGRHAAGTSQGSTAAELNAAPPVSTQPPPSSPALEQADQANVPTLKARAASEAAPTPSAELRSEAPRALAETVRIAPAQTIAKSSAPVDIPTPNPDVRWRIVAGNSVQRTTDGGATWQTQSTGFPVRLTTGAAPSSTICWLVGPGGLVLVASDGRTWQRVAFPERIDLAAILATDGSNATATAADGRVFTTSDGGKTWR